MSFGVPKGISSDEATLIAQIQEEIKTIEGYRETLQKMKETRFQKNPFTFTRIGDPAKFKHIAMTLNALLSYEYPIRDQFIFDQSILMVAFDSGVHGYSMPIEHQPILIPPPVPGVSVRQILECRGAEFPGSTPLLGVAGNEVFQFLGSNRSWRVVFRPRDGKELRTVRTSSDFILIQIDASEVMLLDATKHEVHHSEVLNTERIVECDLCAKSPHAVFVTMENQVLIMSLKTFEIERTVQMEGPGRVVVNPTCDCAIAMGNGFGRVLWPQTEEVRASALPQGARDAALVNNWAFIVAPHMGLQSLFIYALQLMEPVAILTIHNVNVIKVLATKGVKGESMDLVIQGDDGTLSYWVFCPDREEELKAIPLPQFPTVVETKEPTSGKRRGRERSPATKPVQPVTFSPQLGQQPPMQQRRAPKGSRSVQMPQQVPMMYAHAFTGPVMHTTLAPSTPTREDGRPEGTAPRMTLINGADDMVVSISPDKEQASVPPPPPPPPPETANIHLESSEGQTDQAMSLPPTEPEEVVQDQPPLDAPETTNQPNGEEPAPQ